MKLDRQNAKKGNKNWTKNRQLTWNKKQVRKKKFGTRIHAMPLIVSIKSRTIQVEKLQINGQRLQN